MFVLSRASCFCPTVIVQGGHGPVLVFAISCGLPSIACIINYFLHNYIH